MDRLSGMSDFSLCLILSKLTLREAVSASILSRRWRNLWLYLPVLNLSPQNLLSTSALAKPDAVETAEGVINDILFFHSASVQTLILSTVFPGSSAKIRHFSSGAIGRWVKWAVSKNVEEVFLDGWHGGCWYEGVWYKDEVPSYLFSCSTLRTLHIKSYQLLQINTYSAQFRFQFLTDCAFTAVKLKDESLQMLISICPQLHNLKAVSCFRLHYPHICAPNLQHLCLRLHDFEPASKLTAKCPRLVDFEVFMFMVLEIQPMRPLHIDGALVKGIVLNGRYLKTLGLNWAYGKDLHSQDLLKFLICCTHLEDLSITGKLVKHLTAREMSGWPASPLNNLKNVYIHLDTLKMGEISFINCILGSSPKLQTIKITLSPHIEPEDRLGLLESLLGLKRASPEGRIIVG